MKGLNESRVADHKLGKAPPNPQKKQVVQFTDILWLTLVGLVLLLILLFTVTSLAH